MVLNGSCLDTERRLSDHVDGVLGGLISRRVLRHLGRCELCRSVLDSLVRTLEQLRALGSSEESAMPSVAGAVLARISEDRRTR